MTSSPRRRFPTAAAGFGLVGTVVVALALTGPAPVGAHPSKRHRSCYPPHTKTLAASARTRIFESRRRFSSGSRTQHVTYGCLLSRGRAFKFDEPDFPTGYDPIVLAGRYVAYGAYSDCAASFCDPHSVVLQDLKNGKMTFVDGRLPVASVTDLVLRSNGSLAWIQTSFGEDGGFIHPGYQVVKAERGQPPVVLDSGSDVAHGSLALAGATLYWTKAGKPVSTVLG